MHSSLNRLQSVFGSFTTIAFVVATAAALSVLLFPTDTTTTSVQLKNVQVYVSSRDANSQCDYPFDTTRKQY